MLRDVVAVVAVVLALAPATEAPGQESMPAGEPAAAEAPAPQAPRTKAPTPERIVNAVFENLSAEIRDLSPLGNTSGHSSTVLSWVRQTQVSLAESESAHPKHSSLRAECRPDLIDGEYIDFIRTLGYSRRLLPTLELLRGRHVWSCSLAWAFGWGDEKHEDWWHREVIFMLADEEGHPVLRDSFTLNFTP